MADSMKCKPWLHTDIWGDGDFHGGRVHLGVLNPDRQPLTMEGSRVRGWFDGEVYPSPREGGVTPTLEEVRDWVTTAQGVLAGVDGLFATACYDPEQRELFLANDRLGHRPLYYTETDEWFAYAAEVKALLAIRDTLPELDEISLRQFFGFGSMLGERTWWKGIELIPPASVWRVSEKGTVRYRYWTSDDIRPDPRPLEDVLVELGRLWSQAVRQRSKPGTTPQQLSGGLDSRLLLAELCAQGSDVVAITFGQPECPDIKIARRCASIAGVPHRVVHITPENWWHVREEAIWQTDGMVNAMHLHAATAKDEMRTGNCYSPQNISNSFSGPRSERISQVPDWRNSPGEILAQRYRGNPFYGQEEVVSASIADTKLYLVGPRRTCLNLLQGSRRKTITGPLSYAAYCETAYPNYALPLLHLVLGSLSDEDWADGKVYKQFLASRYPRYYSDIPWQRTGRGLTDSIPKKVTRNVKRETLALVGRKLMSPKGFADYPQLVRLSATIETLLRREILADDFLGGTARRALLNGRAQTKREAEALIAIITFETYLRQVAGIPSLNER